ncbi:hypothetical protein ACVWYH_010276 [Bradyrhizobium sp. GM24.11]
MNCRAEIFNAVEITFPRGATQSADCCEQHSFTAPTFNYDLDTLTAAIARAHGPFLEFGVASRRPIKTTAHGAAKAGAPAK